MRLFVYLLLFIFAPGNAQLSSSGCGGEFGARRDRSGSIRYPLLTDRSVFNETTDTSTESLSGLTCTWIIGSHVNQTVWIDVVSLPSGSCLGLKFGDEDKQTYERDERALFSGTGRTIVQWDQRNTEKTSGLLHLRWNVSHSSQDLALVPYTHSEADPVSPSPSSSNRVTYTPDTPGKGSLVLETHTRGGEGVQQGGGVSDLADKSRPLFPQEHTNNEAETAGASISDPMCAGTNSYSDTHSGTDANSASNTHSVVSREPVIASSSAAVRSTLLSVHTTVKQPSDVIKKTSTLSLLDTNDVTRTESHTARSHHTDAQTFTKLLYNTLRAKRGDPTFTTASFLSFIPHNRDTSPFNANSKQEDFPSRSPEVRTMMDPNKDVFSTSESVKNNQLHEEHLAITDEHQPVKSETDKSKRFPMFASLNEQNTDQQTPTYDDSITVSSTSEFPDVYQNNTLEFSESNTVKQSKTSESLDSTSDITEPPTNVTSPLYTTENESTTFIRTEDVLSTKQFMHTSQRSDTMGPSASEASSVYISSTFQSQTRSEPAFISTHNLKLSAFTPTTLPFLTPAEDFSTPVVETETFSYESGCDNLTCTSHGSPTVPQNEERQDSLTTTPPSNLSSMSSSPQMNPNVTSDLIFEDITTLRSEDHTDLKDIVISPSQVWNINIHTSSPPGMSSNTPEPSTYTPNVQYSPPSLENTQSSVDVSGNITHTSVGQTMAVSKSSPTQRSFTTSSKTTPSLSPYRDAPTGSLGNVNNLITQTTQDVLSPSVEITSTHMSHSSVVSNSTHATQSSTVSTTTPHLDASQTSVFHPSLLTTKQSTVSPQTTSTKSPSVQIRTHSPAPESSTIRNPGHISTSSRLTQTNTHITSVTRTPWTQATAFGSDRKWPHGKHFFIVEDQPATIKEETFQVLMQITLEENFAPSVKLHEVEQFLQRVSGYQSQLVTWHSGPVLQTMVRFQTAKALPWLGRGRSLLQEAGLNPLPETGIFVGGAKVKNIKVGGFQEDVCDWLFKCPSGFQCIFLKGNTSCTSVCHFDYCKHQGICVHRPEQQPLCQCPVGEDYWFMGQRCDLRMTRPRLVGVCFGVLIAVATVMALLSCLAVRRFKSMILQAKAEQTRSSYRRFNHFDELSARFWGKSWPGSEDSLENPAFTRSDELLHLRALDRTCCYHDDSLSIVSTYHGSGTHLNTIYPHSSQYGWDLSNCSLADGVVDSGKASDLSVCSWPIEPIQWTPFPLLQQLNKNTTTVKTSRPRSYCEGMELVDLEKSWTA